MASTTTAFYVIQADLTTEVAPAAPHDNLAVGFSSFSYNLGSNGYIQVVHDAVDGISTGAEQINRFLDYNAEPVGAQVDFAEDLSGTAEEIPNSNPDRLAVVYKLEVDPSLPKQNRLRLRWKHIDNQKKEYLFKRIYRYNMLQERDADNPEAIRRSAYGQYWWLNPVGDALDTVSNIFTIDTASLSSFSSVSATSFTFTLTNANTGSGITTTNMRAIFDNYIRYATGGRLITSTMSWISHAANGVDAIDITLNLGGDPADLDRSVIATEILNLLVANGAYSIYEKLAFELGTDTHLDSTVTDANFSLGEAGGDTGTDTAGQGTIAWDDDDI